MLDQVVWVRMARLERLHQGGLIRETGSGRPDQRDWVREAGSDRLHGSDEAQSGRLRQVNRV
jgi:hypothetical protein